MRSEFMDLKDKLILIFFNNFQSNYFLNDLKKLLSLPSSLLDNRIEVLVAQFFLEIDDFATIRVTEKGKLLLRDSNLDKISLPDVLRNIEEADDLESYNRKPIQDINKVYIPVNFDKKL
jgi:hypothetical protein